MKEKYIVIQKDRIDYLEEMVNLKMNEDYIPQGGVCVYFNNYNSKVYYYQAMILEEK